MRTYLLPLYALLLLALAGPALATDGVAEINHTCATQTGCFSGDTAGYPVTIGEAGSYLLTSNLIVPDKNTDGIKLSPSDVGTGEIVGLEFRDLSRLLLLDPGKRPAVSEDVARAIVDALE